MVHPRVLREHHGAANQYELHADPFMGHGYERESAPFEPVLSVSPSGIHLSISSLSVLSMGRTNSSPVVVSKPARNLLATSRGKWDSPNNSTRSSAPTLNSSKVK